jgi:O-antigen/teichoic acid export membrane protein
MGLNTLIIKNISIAIEQENQPLARGYFKTAVSLIIILGLIVTTLGVFVFSELADNIFGKPDLIYPLKLMMLFLLPFSILTLFGEALKGLKQISDSIISQAVIIPGLSLCMLWACNLLELVIDLKMIILAYITSAFVAVAYAWRRWRKNVSYGQTIIIKGREMLRSSFPLLIASSAGLVLTWADVIVLGVFEPSSNVGIYNLCSKVACLTSLVLIAINSIVTPRFAAFYASNNIESLAKLAQQSSFLMISFVTLPTVLFVLWPDWILSFFGSEFVIGRTTLIILAIGQFINVACGSVGYILMMSGNEKKVRDIVIYTAIINIVLNIILVQKLGIEGVAIATATSFMIWNIWMVVVIKKQLGFWVISATIK